MNREQLLEISDWVLGKTKHGELVQGFVETVDSLRGIAKVYVVKCANENTVGKIVTIPLQWLERMSTGTFDDLESLHDLIDLSLLIRDKAWFLELAAKAEAVRDSATEVQTGKARHFSVRNRLGTSAIWEQ